MARSTRSRGGKAEAETTKEEPVPASPKKKEVAAPPSPPPAKKSVAPKKAIKATAAAAAKEEASKKTAAAAAAKKKEAEETKEEAEPMDVDKKEEEEPAEKPKVAPKKRPIRGKKEEVKEEPTKDEKEDEVKEESKEEAKESDTKEETKEEDKKVEEKKEDDKKDEEKKEEEKKEEEDDANAIWSPTEFDVLSGRGASVNSHGGNKKFRALCFARKPEFEAGNHAAKRRIATEIVDAVFNGGEARFLRRKSEKGPWLELNKEQAILKACQVMRDYKRPDRLAIREMMAQNGQARKRSRQVESTPMLDIPVPTGPLEPIIENPYGVGNNDVLCGRGAFVNGHVGNQRLRTFAQERKAAFDAGNYTEKRALASEIVTILKALDPPGRFLKRASKKQTEETKKEEAAAEKKDDEQVSEWEELSDEKSIHKACQVMRDIDRPDRKDREERRAKKKQKLLDVKAGKLPVAEKEGEKKEGDTTNAEKAAVAEAVAATEEALDKALDAAGAKKEETIEEHSVEV